MNNFKVLQEVFNKMKIQKVSPRCGDARAFDFAFVADD